MQACLGHVQPPTPVAQAAGCSAIIEQPGATRDVLALAHYRRAGIYFRVATTTMRWSTTIWRCSSFRAIR